MAAGIALWSLRRSLQQNITGNTTCLFNCGGAEGIPTSVIWVLLALAFLLFAPVLAAPLLCKEGSGATTSQDDSSTTFRRFSGNDEEEGRDRKAAGGAALAAAPAGETRLANPLLQGTLLGSAVAKEKEAAGAFPAPMQGGSAEAAAAAAAPQRDAAVPPKRSGLAQAGATSQELQGAGPASRAWPIQLPLGWEMVLSKSTGQYYYKNFLTREKAWALPQSQSEQQQPQQAEGIAAQQAPVVEGSGASAARAESPLPPYWEKVWNPQKERFLYRNRITFERQFTKPKFWGESVSGRTPL